MRSRTRSPRILLIAALIAISGAALAAGLGWDLLPWTRNLSSAGGTMGSGVPADSAPEARALADRCGNRTNAEKLECYQTGLAAALGRSGVRPAMITLDYLARLDPAVARDAHVYAHHIGIEAYQLSPSVTETFSECTDSFSSGCYHGVIQAYFEDRGSADADVLGALCEPYKDSEQSQWILFQCIHGMGHGLTMYYEHHLPSALEACDLLADRWDRQSCYGGAFMENVMAAIMPHHPATVLASEGADHASHAEAGHGADRDARPSAPTKPWTPLNPEDPLYPCSVMEDRYLKQCYLMQTSVMLHLNGNDLADASRSCDLAPPQMRPTCHQSLGRSISARTKDPEAAAAYCRSGSEQYRGWCYVGVVKAFVDWTAQAESGLAFCQVVDDPGHKAMCYRGLGEEIATLVADGERKASLCGEAEEEFVKFCRRGAQLPAD